MGEVHDPGHPEDQRKPCCDHEQGRGIGQPGQDLRDN